MRKVIVIIGGDTNETYPGFRARMLNFTDNLMDRCNPRSLKITLTTKAPPGFSFIPFRKNKTAAISILDGKRECFDIAAACNGFKGGYLVEEAIPVAYEKSWEDNVPTPGVCLLTLFHPKPDLDRDTFLQRWHEGHTPLSLRIHPLWNYNRNVVKESLTDDSAHYAGIVEEQFRKASDLLNPFRFFGPPLKVPHHMLQVYKDTSSFIDMKRIETYLATEYHIKS